MRSIERNGERKLEQKLITPVSQDNGIKMVQMVSGRELIPINVFKITKTYKILPLLSKSKLCWTYFRLKSLI